MRVFIPLFNFNQDNLEQARNTDFKVEVTENELGSYRWKLVKYFLNGIYHADGRQCLHVSVRFSSFGIDGKIRDMYLGPIVDEIYANRKRMKQPPSSEILYLDLVRRMRGAES